MELWLRGALLSALLSVLAVLVFLQPEQDRTRTSAPFQRLVHVRIGERVRLVSSSLNSWAQVVESNSSGLVLRSAYSPHDELVISNPHEIAPLFEFREGDVVMLQGPDTPSELQLEFVLVLEIDPQSGLCRVELASGKTLTKVHRSNLLYVVKKKQQDSFALVSSDSFVILDALTSPSLQQTPFSLDFAQFCFGFAGSKSILDQIQPTRLSLKLLESLEHDLPQGKHALVLVDIELISHALVYEWDGSSKVRMYQAHHLITSQDKHEWYTIHDWLGVSPDQGTTISLAKQAWGFGQSLSVQESLHVLFALLKELAQIQVSMWNEHLHDQLLEFYEGDASKVIPKFESMEEYFQEKKDGDAELLMSQITHTREFALGFFSKESLRAGFLSWFGDDPDELESNIQSCWEQAANTATLEADFPWKEDNQDQVPRDLVKGEWLFIKSRLTGQIVVRVSSLHGWRWMQLTKRMTGYYQDPGIGVLKLIETLMWPTLVRDDGIAFGMTVRLANPV